MFLLRGMSGGDGRTLLVKTVVPDWLFSVVWALALMLFMAAYATPREALHFLESRSFTEPAFIFVIMVIAASRPVLDFAGAILSWLARLGQALPEDTPTGDPL